MNIFKYPFQTKVNRHFRDSLSFRKVWIKLKSYKLAAAKINNFWGGDVQNFSLQAAPKPMRPNESTNESSKMQPNPLLEEETSMVIEANGSMIRLNVKKTKGKVN